MNDYGLKISNAEIGDGCKLSAALPFVVCFDSLIPNFIVEGCPKIPIYFTALRSP